MIDKESVPPKGKWTRGAWAVLIALGMGLPVSGLAAQDGSSLEAAVKEVLAFESPEFQPKAAEFEVPEVPELTVEEILDLARHEDKINRSIEETRGLSEVEQAYLDYLESVGDRDPAEADRQFFEMRNSERK